MLISYFEFTNCHAWRFNLFYLKSLMATKDDEKPLAEARKILEEPPIVIHDDETDREKFVEQEHVKLTNIKNILLDYYED